MDVSRGDPDATEAAAVENPTEPHHTEPGGEELNLRRVQTSTCRNQSCENMVEGVMMSQGRGQANRERMDKKFVALVANAAMKMHERAVKEAELNQQPDPERTEARRQLRDFVDRLIFEVLIRCGAVIGCGPEDCVGHVGRLAEQVMSGLPEAPPPHMHACQKVAESVIRKLQHKLGRKVLRYVLLSPDPSAQSLVVQCFQARVKKHMTHCDPRAAKA